MKVLVSGSRDYQEVETIYYELDKLKPSAIIQGGARGADEIAAGYAIDHGLPNIEVKANWTILGRAAGSIRNKWMLDFCDPDLVLAFPLEKSVGTWHMVNIAKQAGIPVLVIQ